MAMAVDLLVKDQMNVAVWDEKTGLALDLEDMACRRDRGPGAKPIQILLQIESGGARFDDAKVIGGKPFFSPSRGDCNAISASMAVSMPARARIAMKRALFSMVTSRLP